MGQKINRCAKCRGEGRLWWYELEEYHGPATQGQRDDTQYTCDTCCGEEDRDVVYQGFDPVI